MTDESWSGPPDYMKPKARVSRDIPDRELNALIATVVMGWHDLGGGHYLAKFNCSRYLATNPPPFKPSTEIKSAWEMEEAIAKKNLWREYGKALVDILGTVEAPPENRPRLYSTTSIEAWYLIHASPRDRCLAALKVVGIEMDKR